MNTDPDKSGARNIVRSAIAKIITVVLAAFCMPALLVLSAMIPKENIRDNMLRSAEYLYGSELFGDVIEGIDGSRIDRYADSILLNIAYHYDNDHPIRSVMLSAYYFTPYHEENENLLIAVRDDMGMNRQYLRYWHGSIAVIRPILTLMPINGIYILNGAVILALIALYIYVFAKDGDYAAPVALLISLIITRSFYVPFSCEYAPTYILMLVSSCIAVILYKNGQSAWLNPLFFITGMATSFADFLTTETLTLLVPLISITWLMRKDSKGSAELTRRTVILTILWACGYVVMWASKWLLCSVIFSENAMQYVTEHVSERLGGYLGLNMWQYITGAVTKNIGCLFPLGYGAVGGIIFIGLIIFAAYRGYVYNRGSVNGNFVATLVVMAIIPYIRYIVLHNHSYIHYFFTYRAQAATVMAIVLIVWAITEKKDG